MSQTPVTPASPPDRKSAVPEKKKRTGLAVFLLAATVLLIGVAALGISSRDAATAKLQQRADEAAELVVQAVHPEKDSGMIHLQLPGRDHALHRCADLCSDQRLPESLVFRHRR